MIKIVLVSDNHGNKELLKNIRMLHYDADYYLCCGDFVMSDQDIKESGYLGVKGNCDYYATSLPYEHFIEVLDHKIMLVHGHRFYDIYGDKKSLANYAKAHDCELVFYGHTHVFKDELVDGIGLVNPGSVKYNKDFTNPSYAIIELDHKIIKVIRKEV